MRYGLSFANIGPLATAEGAAAIAEACDAHGIESLWPVEHPAVPASYESEYPYHRSGKMPMPAEAPMPDPLVWLTWVAAHSREVRLGTGVLILPLRNPVILAKEVATLDSLSGGRVELGVGVGWLEEEFGAVGVPFAGRGERTDEYIEVLRALWSDGAASFDGDLTSFRDMVSSPKPANGTVPIVIGGHSHAAARRAGRLGDGFFPAKHDDLAELVSTLRKSAREAGRDPDGIELTFSGTKDPAKRSQLEDLGATRLVFGAPLVEPDAVAGAIEQLLDSLA